MNRIGEEAAITPDAGAGELLRLYDYPASANCYKVRLLLALLGREYERVEVDIFAGETLADAYGRVSATRRTPVLELPDGATIEQSNAILWFLAEGSSFLPTNSTDRAHVLQWMAFEQEFMLAGVGGARFRRLTERDPAGVEFAQTLGAAGLWMLETQLAEHPYVLGERCSAADVSLFGYTHVAPEAGLELAHHPAIQAWLLRIQGLPGFVDDLAPYPPNARSGASNSIYDQLLS